MNASSDSQQKPKRHEVHQILAHSYLVYFTALVLGIIFDFAFPIRIIPGSIAISLGIFFLFISPMLIVWAQRASYKFSIEKSKESGARIFLKGPYAFTRSPTHLGLNFLIMGLGFLLNSISIVALSLLAFFITKLFFLRKEEMLLGKKYGEEYLEYKKSVNKWI